MRSAPAVVALQRPLVQGDDGAGLRLRLGSSPQLQQAVRQVEHAHLAQLPPCVTGRTPKARCGVSRGRAHGDAGSERTCLHAWCPPPGSFLRAGTSPQPPETCCPCSRSGGRLQRTNTGALADNPTRAAVRERERRSAQTYLTSALPCVFSISDACAGVAAHRTRHGGASRRLVFMRTL